MANETVEVVNMTAIPPRQNNKWVKMVLENKNVLQEGKALKIQTASRSRASQLRTSFTVSTIPYFEREGLHIAVTVRDKTVYVYLRIEQKDK